MMTVDVYLSIGTNQGDRERNIKESLSRLDDALGEHWTALSSIIETKSWGFDGADFLNCAVLYRLRAEQDSEKQALELLDTIKKIEAEMGRTGDPEYDTEGRRIYHSRIIDIDILLFGDVVMDHPRLKIPHPLMKKRDFVMIPLSEILKEKEEYNL